MAWWTQPRVYPGLLLVDTWGKPYSRIQQQKLRSDSVWRNNDREILQMYECVILKTFFILSLSLALRAFCVVSVREHEWPRQYGGRQVLWAKEHHRQSARPDQSRSMSGYLPCICSRWVKPDSSLLTSNLFSVQQGCDTLKYSTWHKTWEFLSVLNCCFMSRLGRIRPCCRGRREGHAGWVWPRSGAPLPQGHSS